uniref:Astacin domain-containing protein n=1 Tax=Panagrellus redivivus TaxID=6233 RepID=A0A7E4V977_PANRE
MYHFRRLHRKNRGYVIPFNGRLSAFSPKVQPIATTIAKSENCALTSQNDITVGIYYYCIDRNLHTTTSDCVQSVTLKNQSSSFKIAQSISIDRLVQPC